MKQELMMVAAVAAQKPMTADTVGWLASNTKAVK